MAFQIVPAKIDLSSMTNYRAIGVIEGWFETDSEAVILAAWQHLLDNGLVYQLQSWYGEHVKQLIAEGKLRDNSGNTATYGETNE